MQPLALQGVGHGGDQSVAGGGVLGIHGAVFRPVGLVLKSAECVDSAAELVTVVGLNAGLSRLLLCAIVGATQRSNSCSGKGAEQVLDKRLLRFARLAAAMATQVKLHAEAELFRQQCA